MRKIGRPLNVHVPVYSALLLLENLFVSAIQIKIGPLSIDGALLIFVLFRMLCFAAGIMCLFPTDSVYGEIQEPIESKEPNVHQTATFHFEQFYQNNGRYEIYRHPNR